MHGRKRMAERNQRGDSGRLNALVAPLRRPQSTTHVPTGCGGNILRRDVADTVHMHILQRHTRMEREGRKNHTLSRRIQAIHIRRRVRLRVPQALRLNQNLVKTKALWSSRRECSSSCR